MNVIFLPDYTHGDPHQRLLADALHAQGVTVKLCQRSGRWPVLQAIRMHGKPDVLHLHWTDNMMLGTSWPTSVLIAMSFILQILVAKAVGIRIVWTVHNLNNHEHRFDAIENTANTILVRLYDSIIVYCDIARASVIAKYRIPKRRHSRIILTHLGTQAGYYRNDIDRDLARKELNIDPKEFVFLHFGRIRPYKGIDTLLVAFDGLTCPAARMLIAGNPTTEDIRQMIESRADRNPRVTAHLCRINDDDVQRYMNAADVVVLPFRDVLNSSSAMLAMSFGKAVIAPRAGCLQEMLDDTGSILYQSDRDDELIAALRSALTADTASMGRHNASLAQSFDWNTIAAHTITAYQSGPMQTSGIQAGERRERGSI